VYGAIFSNRPAQLAQCAATIGKPGAAKVKSVHGMTVIQFDKPFGSTPRSVPRVPCTQNEWLLVWRTAITAEHGVRPIDAGDFAHIFRQGCQLVDKRAVFPGRTDCGLPSSQQRVISNQWILYMVTQCGMLSAVPAPSKFASKIE
jgi:hypothetical protein